MPLSDVPALSRGLRLLEAVAASGPLTFGDLLERCRFPKASVARLLAVLRADGYLSQDEARGGYRLGERCRLLAGGVDQAERLRLVALPHLHRLAEARANSVILLQVEGLAMRCLERVVIEDSVVLQAPGDWRQDLGMGPWGSIIVSGLEASARRQALARMADPAAFEAGFPADLRQLQQQGYVLDDGRLRPGLRRLGVPLRDRSGTLIAILGLGGTPWSLDDQAVGATAQRMQAAATAIAEELALPGAPDA